MGDRGRQSAAEVAHLAENNVIPLKRPCAPAELTDEQAEEWHKITDSLPADWFPKETWPVLAQLCRHITRARRFAALLQDMEAQKPGEDGKVDIDLKLYRDLSRSEEEQSRAIASLSTKLRITNQATVDKRTNRNKGSGPSWDHQRNAR